MKTMSSSFLKTRRLKFEFPCLTIMAPEQLFLTFFEDNLVKVIFRPLTRRYSLKKVFLEISQNSQENTCARVSFFKRVSSTGVFL